MINSGYKRIGNDQQIVSHTLVGAFAKVAAEFVPIILEYHKRI